MKKTKNILICLLFFFLIFITRPIKINAQSCYTPTDCKTLTPASCQSNSTCPSHKEYKGKCICYSDKDVIPDEKTLDAKIIQALSASGLVSNVGAELKKTAVNPTCFGPFCYTDIGCLVANGLQWALIISSLLLLVYLAWGGIQWSTSGGDKAGLEAAKSRISAAIIGAVIVISVWALYLLLRTTLGLPIGIGGKCNFTNTQKPATGGAGSNPGTGQLPKAWSCNAYPCDCCNIYQSDNAVKCCQQVGSLTSCVVARNKNNDKECRNELFVDFNCWRENYTRLVNEGKLNPSNDRCDTTKYPQ